MNGKPSTLPATGQFIAVAVFTVLLNVVFQYLLARLTAFSIPPVFHGLLETIAVAVFAVPPAYYFYMRPLRSSLRERLAAEKILRKSEMHYRIVSELTTTFVFDLSVANNGKVTLDSVSNDFSAFAGRNKEEVGTFESWLEHVHPEDRSVMLQALHDLTTESGSREVECRAYVGDPHEMRWLRVCGKSEQDEETGRVTAIYGAVKDVTRHKKAEEARVKSERHLASVIRATPIALWDVDKGGTITLSEGSALGKFGVKPGELVGKSVYEVYKDAPEVLAHVRRGLDGEEISTETRIADTYWSTDFAPRRDERENIVGLVGVSVDISARKQAEEALRESERKYSILFHREMLAIHVFDLETLRILDVNEAHIRLYGYEKEELLSGMTVLDLTNERDESRSAIDRIRSEGEAYVPVRYHRKKDGTVFPVATVCSSCTWKGREVCFASMRDISERKKTEEDQAKVQNLLSVSQRLAHIGSWEYEMSTGEISLSDEMYRIIGLPVKSPVSLDHVQAFLPPEEVVRSRKAIETSIRDGIPYFVDFEIRRADGQSRILHNEGEVVFDEQGKAVRIFGISQDITENKLAEDALQQKTKIVNTLYENVSEVIFYLTVETEDTYRFQSVNPAFLKTLGLEESRVIGKLVSEVIPEPSLVSFQANLAKAIRNRAAVRWEEVTGSPAGNKVGEVAVAPAFDQHGECRNLIGTIYDVTERKKAEEAIRENEKRLQASETKYRELIETAPEAISVVEDGKIVFCNARALELLGCTYEEVAGARDLVMTSKEDTSQAMERYRARAEGQRLPKGTYRVVTKHGKVIWLEVLGRRIDWEGKPAVLYFNSDITDRKDAENDRLKYEQYLQQAQRLESLEVLAGGIAHDFNNILTGVFGFTDLAKREAHDATVSAYLSQAMLSMERARALTQQLLTFSKGGAPVRKIVSVSALVMESCKFALHGSNIKDSYDIQENLWHCNIDRNQIAQVIENLMINAVQAMPMGGTIEVRAKNIALQEREHATLEEGSYVVVSIRDQGVGISEEMLSRIYDPFFTTKIKGHGLGLAIAHSIITRHNGAINVQSELDRGTTFSIYLPACGESCEEDEMPVVTEHRGAGRVLLMDDEEPVRKLISTMLESFGYSVVCTDNGRDTIEAFVEASQGSSPFSAVILDLTIPGESGGKEVAQEIRNRDKDIPLFVASGYAGDPIISRPQKYGFTASISKPFTRNELVQMLEGHIGSRK